MLLWRNSRGQRCISGTSFPVSKMLFYIRDTLNKCWCGVTEQSHLRYMETEMKSVLRVGMSISGTRDVIIIPDAARCSFSISTPYDRIFSSRTTNLIVCTSSECKYWRWRYLGIDYPPPPPPPHSAWMGVERHIWSVDLKVRRRGAVLPAAWRFHDDRTAQRTRPFPVEPQTQTVFTEHMLKNKSHTHTHTKSLASQCFPRHPLMG